MRHVELLQVAGDAEVEVRKGARERVALQVQHQQLRRREQRLRHGAVRLGVPGVVVVVVVVGMVVCVVLCHHAHALKNAWEE